MKKILKYLLLILLSFILLIIFLNHPISSSPKALAQLSDTIRIRKNLETIINTSDYRNYDNVEILDSVSQFLKEKFSENTKRVSFQEFEVRRKKYRNVIASFGPESGKRIIIGAHYDVCLFQDGADDNASGVAGLLELSNLLAKANPKYRIDLVAYSLEEPPDFGTEDMGSYVHAKYLSDNNIDVFGMISLEMIGVFSDQKDSQEYPVGFLKWFYGDKGDYIAITQKLPGGGFASRFKSAYFQNNSIPAKSIKAPAFFGGIDLSDHANYWEFGYSAVMVTNTAFYRNKFYHTKGDNLDRLNVPKIGLVIDGVYRSILKL